MSALDRVAYRFFWSLLWLVCKAWFRFRVVEKQNLPAEEAYILTPVHRSYLDTPVGGMVTARRQRFLGKESLWRNRAAGRFLTIVGGFPVERGTADRAALRACQEVLERGEPMVMFPEGTRQHGPVVDPDLMHAGPAFVAARAGVPIVPLGIAVVFVLVRARVCACVLVRARARARACSCSCSRSCVPISSHRRTRASLSRAASILSFPGLRVVVAEVVRRVSGW